MVRTREHTSCLLTHAEAWKYAKVRKFLTKIAPNYFSTFPVVILVTDISYGWAGFISGAVWGFGIPWWGSGKTCTECATRDSSGHLPSLFPVARTLVSPQWTAAMPDWDQSWRPDPVTACTFSNTNSSFCDMIVGPEAFPFMSDTSLKLESNSWPFQLNPCGNVGVIFVGLVLGNHAAVSIPRMAWMAENHFALSGQG